MAEARRKAEAFASELAGAYPTAQITRDTLKSWSTAFNDCLDVADDVSALLRLRSTYPPAVAQIYEAAREVRKETVSEWSTWDCIFADGVVCPNCSRFGQQIVHGHLLHPSEVAEKLHALGYDADKFESPAERVARAKQHELEAARVASELSVREHSA